MALYFKCTKCGHIFIDYDGENAQDITDECYINGPYLCPICNEISSVIDYKKYIEYEQNIKNKA